MSREDILLKEYEVCQQEKNSAASNYWLPVQIFVGIITVILGGLAYAFTTQDINIPGLIMVIVFSLTAILILIYLHKWLKRVNHLIGINNRRQCEIEVTLGMSKNVFVWGLDNWGKIPKSFRRKIADTWEEADEAGKEKACNSDKKDDIPDKYRPPKIGKKVIENLLYVVGAPWIIVIIIAVVLLILRIIN